MKTTQGAAPNYIMPTTQVPRPRIEAYIKNNGNHDTNHQIQQATNLNVRFGTFINQENQIFPTIFLALGSPIVMIY